jgi:serine/threonine-protein kinase RsbW
VTARVGQAGDMDPPPLIVRFAALPEHVGPARRAAVAYARDHGITDTVDLAIAVSEALTNAVEHAYVDAAASGEVQLTVQRHLDDGLEVEVRDDGRGVKPRPDSPGAGLGLPLMATAAERLEIERRPGGGTRVRMVFAAA